MIGDDHAGQTYDRIADHFSATRTHPWPEVASFCEGRSGGLGLDLGCGNGRHVAPLGAAVDEVVAVDASRRLLSIAAAEAAPDARSFAPVCGDAGRLPLRADAVDLAVYVATVHHLRPRRRRVASLDELARVLAPGGRALVSAWSTAHDRFDATADDATGFDAAIDWTLPDGETVPRFYHVYAPAEFDADLAASALAVESSFLSSGNCYAVVGPGPTGQ